MSVFEAQFRTLSALEPMRVSGRVVALRGLTVLVRDLPLAVGSLVEVKAVRGGSGGGGRSGGTGEIVGFNGEHTIVMMLGPMTGIRAGDCVVGKQATPTVGVGDELLGRVIDGLGRPIDGLGAFLDTRPREVDPPPIGAMARSRIGKPLYTGVRAIDLMTTLGRGQRMGIFAGPGVGKSTLLASIARHARSDVNVLALIGERGREVRDFVEGSLGKEGLARSVVVASTSDESPLMRIRAALVACAAAEHFRDEGKHVMLLVDSVTRFAQAQRQVGLSVGEPPASKGYTPSVFAQMARLLERAGSLGEGGPNGPGSITGLYTILVEGDDMTEPVADAARGILDGHIVLSRALAHKGHYPAIDVLDSVSRVADDVSDATHVAARRQVAKLLAGYREVEDLVQIGAYAKGSSAEADLAIAYQPRLVELLRQESRQFEPFEKSRERLVKIAMESGNRPRGPRK